MTSLRAKVNMNVQNVPLVASAWTRLADIDVTSGHDAIEWGDDLLIGLLLTQHQQLRPL